MKIGGQMSTDSCVEIQLIVFVTYLCSLHLQNIKRALKPDQSVHNDRFVNLQKLNKITSIHYRTPQHQNKFDMCDRLSIFSHCKISKSVYTIKKVFNSRRLYQF